MTVARGMLALDAVVATVVFLIVVTGEDESAGPESGVTLGDVLDDPEGNLGREVTVSGEVKHILVDPGAFTIGDRVAAREDDLVVVPRRRAGRVEVDATSVVRVHGEVFRLPNPPDEDDVLFEDEEDDALDEFEGEPAIAATRVEVIRR